MSDLPPLIEFREIPLYDREGYFYDNPIDRYSINSYMLKRGKLCSENGKLTIRVQNQEPTDANQRKNCYRHRRKASSSPLAFAVLTDP